MGPNEALAVACEDMRDLYTSGTHDNFGTHDIRNLVEGFVVIETDRRTILAVCANYFLTATGPVDFDASNVQGPTGASLKVVCYDPLRIRGRFTPAD